VSQSEQNLNLDGTVTVVPEIRRKPSNAQINRETTVLGGCSRWRGKTTKSSTAAHSEAEEPAQPRKVSFGRRFRPRE